jgi:hypothetical protein
LGTPLVDAVEAVWNLSSWIGVITGKDMLTGIRSID